MTGTEPKLRCGEYASKREIGLKMIGLLDRVQRFLQASKRRIAATKHVLTVTQQGTGTGIAGWVSRGIEAGQTIAFPHSSNDDGARIGACRDFSDKAAYRIEVSELALSSQRCRKASDHGTPRGEACAGDCPHGKRTRFEAMIG